MVAENLVREITEMVIEKLQKQHTKALVIFDDAVIGADAALENLRDLRSCGFRFDVLMSRGAYENQNIEAIRSALEPEYVWVQPDWESFEIPVSPYEALLVATLTVNTAAHLAMGMANTLIADVIMNWLLRGKTVVIAKDASCPVCLMEADEAFQMAEALAQRMRSNLETLLAYGAALTKAGQLKETTMHLLRQDVSRKAEIALKEKNLYSTSNKVERKNLADVFSGKILGAADVLATAEDSVIHVGPCTMVTQLAQEEARRKHIEIVRDE